MASSAAPFYTRHRGPYRLQVLRLTGKRLKPYSTEFLQGVSDGPEVAEEAVAILNDPRDTVAAVYVFSETEQQFVMTYSAGAQS